MLIVAVLATAHAAWPRLETGATWYRAVHVPKSGGTTHDRALVAIYCFHAGQETCMRQCHVKKKGRIRGELSNIDKAHNVAPGGPPCKPGGSAHRASLQFCLDVYGLRDVYGGALTRRVRNASLPQYNAACSTALRDPYERAVSGWFYRGHHPGSDFFRVGWPPVHGFLDGGASTEISFENYLRTRAYADVFTRMLGANGRAYDGAAVPDFNALERATRVLQRIPFALLADMERSYVLIAHAFSTSKATCTRIRRRLLPLARSRVRDNRSEKHDRLLNDAGRRALFEGYNRLDMALYRNATAIWCAEWYNAIGDRESCVRTYAHARPGTPPPCQ